MRELEARRPVASGCLLGLVVRSGSLELRGHLVREPERVCWYPAGWFGRRAFRGAPFEVPDREYAAIVVRSGIVGRALLTFETARGSQVHLDHRRPVALYVRPRDAAAILPTWSLTPTARDRRTTAWSRT